jgi:hypothetical protein
VVAELLKARRDVPLGAHDVVRRHAFLDEALNTQLDETMKRFRATNVAFKKDYLHSFHRDDPHLLELSTHHNKVARAKSKAKRSSSAPTIAGQAMANLLQEAGPALDTTFEEREKKRMAMVKRRRQVEHAELEEKEYPKDQHGHAKVPTSLMYDFIAFIDNSCKKPRQHPVTEFFRKLDFFTEGNSERATSFESLSLNEWLTALKLMGFGDVMHPDQQSEIFRGMQENGAISFVNFKRLQPLFDLQKLATTIGVTKAKEQLRIARQKNQGDYVPDQPQLSVQEQTKQLAAMGGFGGRMAMARQTTMVSEQQKAEFSKMVKAKEASEPGSPKPAAASPTRDAE